MRPSSRNVPQHHPVESPEKTGSQEHQIALLWQAVAQLSAAAPQATDCVPDDAAREAQFQTAHLNDLVGK